MPGGEPLVVPVRRDHPFTPNFIVVDEVSMLDVFPANKGVADYPMSVAGCRLTAHDGVEPGRLAQRVDLARQR